MFSGKWVFDNTSYPLYNESRCPYMSDQLACHKHGRSDLGYQYWRWQPHHCNLKRYSISAKLSLIGIPFVFFALSSRCFSFSIVFEVKVGVVPVEKMLLIIKIEFFWPGY